MDLKFNEKEIYYPLIAEELLPADSFWGKDSFFRCKAPGRLTALQYMAQYSYEYRQHKLDTVGYWKNKKDTNLRG